MAKDAIKQIGQVVIVEGYVDAVIAHQYGTKQTVACIGSAITEKHIQQLKKLTKQVTLALDPDAAGSAATEHGIQEALRTFDHRMVPVPLPATEGPARKAQGQYGREKQSQPRGIIRLEEQTDAEINVLQLPAGEDPDEVIRRDFSTWFYAVSHPMPLIDYYFVVKTADLNLREPGGKTEAARRLLPVIGMIRDRIKRDSYVQRLTRMIRVDERDLHIELQRVLREQKVTGVNAEFSDRAMSERKAVSYKGGAAPEISDFMEETDATAHAQQVAQSSQGIKLDRSQVDTLKWEDYLIGLLLQNPGLYLHVCGIINDGDFTGTDTRELYNILNSVYQRDPSPSLQPFEQFVPAVLLSAVARALKSVESGSLLDGGELVKSAVQCATRLRRTRLLQLNKDLKFLIQDADEAGDMPATRQLYQRGLEIQRLLRTINTATRLQG